MAKGVIGVRFCFFLIYKMTYLLGVLYLLILLEVEESIHFGKQKPSRWDLM